MAAVALAIAALDLLGVDVRGWFSDVWDALTGVGLGYLIAGWTFQTAQTTLTALGWYFILRAGFPDAPVLYRRCSPRTRRAWRSTGSCRRTSAPSRWC